MTATIDITRVLAKHLAWLQNEPDLRSADLRSADLYGADLGGADLGAHVILQIGPVGSRRDYLTYCDGEVRTGCFAGTLAEFAAAVEQTHGGNEHGVAYHAAIAMLTTLSAARDTPAATGEVPA
jgi:pentapeptide repeat protein